MVRRMMNQKFLINSLLPPNSLSTTKGESLLIRIRRVKRRVLIPNWRQCTVRCARKLRVF